MDGAIVKFEGKWSIGKHCLRGTSLKQHALSWVAPGITAHTDNVLRFRKNLVYTRVFIYTYIYIDILYFIIN